MGLSTYYTYSIGKGKEYPLNFKFNACLASDEIGIKPAAKRFKIAPNTLRSWRRKLSRKGKKGLEDRRQGPKYIPHKISQELEEKIIGARKKIPCYGPRRLKYFFDFPCSLGAIQRVIKQKKLTRKRRKRYQKKQDLRAIKAKRQSLTHLQMDLKHLRDIPNYWEQLKPLKLPKYQYTVRDTKSGMLFLGYSEELSELNARTMIDYVLSNLRTYVPFNFNDLTVQTDNGSEFSGQARRLERAPFVQMVTKTHGAKHVYIRPGHCNANADVESLHELIENEFYDLTTFSSKDDFFKKAESYRLYFNFVRPNFSKNEKTPEIICSQDWNSKLSINSSLIKTIDLDKISTFSYQREGVQTIPDFAVSLKTSLKTKMSRISRDNIYKSSISPACFFM